MTDVPVCLELQAKSSGAEGGDAPETSMDNDAAALKEQNGKLKQLAMKYKKQAASLQAEVSLLFDFLFLTILG